MDLNAVILIVAVPLNLVVWGTTIILALTAPKEA